MKHKYYISILNICNDHFYIFKLKYLYILTYLNKIIKYIYTLYI